MQNRQGRSSKSSMRSSSPEDTCQRQLPVPVSVAPRLWRSVFLGRVGRALDLTRSQVLQLVSNPPHCHYGACRQDFANWIHLGDFLDHLYGELFSLFSSLWFTERQTHSAVHPRVILTWSRRV